MLALEFDTEFASVSFRVEGVDATVRGRTDCPACEPIHRIDWCVVDALSFPVEPESEFMVWLEFQPKDGWSFWLEGGEFFDCILLEHTDRHQACIGMRDYEWIAQRYGLVVLEAAMMPDPFRVRFKATRQANIQIEISLALTKSPVTHYEELSPWIATDRAMKF